MGEESTKHSLVRRRFNFEQDYDMLALWWKNQNLTPPPPDALSQTGVIVSINGEDSAMSFLYKTDSSFCVLAFTVCNPDIRGKERDMSLDYLIDSAIEWCNKSGFKSIMCNSEHPKFIKRLVGKGFKIPVDNVKHLFFIGDNNG